MRRREVYVDVEGVMVGAVAADGGGIDDPGGEGAVELGSTAVLVAGASMGAGAGLASCSVLWGL